MDSKLDNIMKQAHYKLICCVMIPSPDGIIYRFFDSIGYYTDYLGVDSLPKLYKQWLFERNDPEFCFPAVMCVSKNELSKHLDLLTGGEKNG